MYFKCYIFSVLYIGHESGPNIWKLQVCVHDKLDYQYFFPNLGYLEAAEYAR